MNTKTKLILPNLTDDPAYAAAVAKYTELQGKMNAANARYDAVIGELNVLATNPSRRINVIEAAAYKLLGIGTAGASAGANASALRSELSDLAEDRQVLTAAVSIQKEIVTVMKGEVSRRCIAPLLPIHREMVRECVKRALALDEALDAEHRLRDELFMRNISLGELRPMPMVGFGKTRDENSRVSAYLIEARVYGFIDIGEVPERLRPYAKAKMATAMPAEQTPAVATRDAADWVTSE